MKILIIGGGLLPEREVSLRSARAVFDGAIEKGYEAEYYDWDGSENWLLDHVQDFAAVLPILHGVGGEDGKIQQILEKTNVPYLGSDSEVSALCFNKQKTHALLSASHIKIPKSNLVTFEQYQQDELFNQPHVLKPYNSGSSIDTFIYPDPNRKDIDEIRKAFERHGELLLEEYIDGVEISVPVLEGKELPVIEIVIPENLVFDYENKYNGAVQELVPPENISPAMQQQVQDLAQQINQLAGCRHLCRIDMIVQNEVPYVLEINTLPGMTDQSLFPKTVTAAGMEFPEFVDYLIKLVTRKV